MKVFTEEQRFTQWWIYVVLAIPFFVILFQFVFQDKQINNEERYINDTTISFFSMFIITMFIVSIKLKTRIDDKGLKYQFFPFLFINRFISWDEIKSIHIRKYNPITEYGGWGIKGRILFNNHKGVAYNIRGNIGVQLELKNGKKILIGTQKENEAKRVLETYRDKIIDYEI